MQAEKRNRNFPIVQIKQFATFDKLLMVWTICCIDYYTKTNQRHMLARYYMQQEYGEDVANYFEWIVEWLIPYKVINTDHLTLTPSGQHVADNWQAVSNKLINID